jgi:hypothetical protein
MCRSISETGRRCAHTRDYRAERAQAQVLRARRAAGLTCDQVATETSVGLLSEHIHRARMAARVAATEEKRDAAQRYEFEARARLAVVRAERAAAPGTMREVETSTSTSTTPQLVYAVPSAAAVHAVSLQDPDRHEAVTRDWRRTMTDLQVALEQEQGDARRHSTREAQEQSLQQQIRELAPPHAWDEDGYSTSTGLHRETRVDGDGYDAAGFKRLEDRYNNQVRFRWIHRETQDAYGPDGYDRAGLDALRVDRRGFSARTGLHTVTGRRLDVDGYDREGYDRRGFDALGYTRDGTRVNSWGVDAAGNRVGEATVRERLDGDLRGASDRGFDLDMFMAEFPDASDDDDCVGPDGKGRRGPTRTERLMAAERAALDL